jgi:hypothetical protein
LSEDGRGHNSRQQHCVPPLAGVLRHVHLLGCCFWTLSLVGWETRSKPLVKTCSGYHRRRTRRTVPLRPGTGQEDIFKIFYPGPTASGPTPESRARVPATSMDAGRRAHRALGMGDPRTCRQP